MAWHSDAYVSLSYTGDSYLSIFDFSTSAGGYVSVGYTATGYTGLSYNGFPTEAEISFNAAGDRAEVEVQGNIAGFQFIKQGTSADIEVDTHWPGFLPDTDGILDNDSDPDGDPLSYTVVDQPEAGTLTAYAGGAFEWDPGAAPPGRYTWTYRLFAGGEQSDDLGIVTIEYGDLFASVGVQGFEAEFGFGFTEQGTTASVLVTGFAGDMLLTLSDSGTAADVDCEGFAGSVTYGFTQLGTRAQVSVQGNSGIFFGTFSDQGSRAEVTCEGFAGDITLGVFFSGQGTAASVSAEGNAGTIDTGGFSYQGSGAQVIPLGGSGNMRIGLLIQGTAAEVDVYGGFAQFPPTLIPRGKNLSRRDRSKNFSVGTKKTEHRA